MIDLLALLAIAGISAFGWARGAKGMALWGLSLVVGSLVAAYLARPTGMILARRADISLLAAIPLAGMVLAGLATAIARTAARKVGRERKVMLDAGWEPPDWDPWVGAGLGALCGTGIVLFAAWVGNATGHLHGRQEQIRASLVGRAAANVGEPVIRVVAGEMVGNAVMASTAAFLVSDPDAAKETLESLVTDPRVRGLAQDPTIRQAVLEGNAGAMSRSPALRSLAQDPAFIRAARRMQMIPDGPTDIVTPEELAEGLVERLGSLAHVADAVARNPQVQATLNDPAFQEALSRGDMATLLSQGGLNELMETILSELENRS